MEFTSLCKFYRNHIEEDLLSFWIRALDYQNGGIYTCFNNRGDQLISKDKYTWSQGRFIWSWTKVVKMILKNRLYGKTEFYLEHLDKTISFLERNVFMENGNCAFLLSETGEKKVLLVVVLIPVFLQIVL